jgi:alanyl-tRNA synthetase
VTIEMAGEIGLEVDEEGFKKSFEEHQELARSVAKGEFKSGLGGDGEMETKYHTATHLLNAALKRVVGETSCQKGSNITAERLRFDFACDHKLTEDEIKSAEKLVNDWINNGYDVICEEMAKEKAVEVGAEHQFLDRYPDIVTVYSIGDVSKEICTGPHVKNTKELGVFKIKKEEASSSGVRRIKAILEN